MSKFNFIQNSFTAGEVSDKFKGRTDFEQYKQGLDLLQNFIPQKQGGVAKRPGSRLFQDLGHEAALIPFISSANDSYVLAIRTTPVTDSTDTVDDTTDIFTSTGAATLNMVTQDSIRFTNVTGTLPAPLEEGVTYFAIKLTATTFQLAASFADAGTGTQIDITTSPTFTADMFITPFVRVDVYKSDGTVQTDALGISPAIRTDFIDMFNLDINGFHWAQSGDVLFLTHASGTMRPKIIYKKPGVKISGSFVGGVEEYFEMADYNTGIDVTFFASNPFLVKSTPFLPPNIDGDKKLRPSALSGSGITLFSEDNGGSPRNFFDDRHVGAIFKLTSGTHTGIVLITSITSQTEAVGNIIVNFLVSTATDNFQESAWSEFRGFPKTVSIFQQRLSFGGTDFQPDTLQFSVTGNLFHLMERRLAQDATSDSSGYKYFGDATDDDPFSIAIASNQINGIQWQSSGDALQVGSLGSEYIIRGSDAGFSASSLSVRQQTDFGGSPVYPAKIGERVLFVSRDGRRIRDFKFNDENGSFISSNLSIMNEEIVFQGFDGGVAESLKDIKFIELMYQPSRETLWLLNSKKELVSVTVSREANVVAWARHPFKDGTEILSIASVPNENATYDDLFILAKRTINSTVEHYIERISDDFDHSSLATTSSTVDDAPFYSDSSIRVVLGSSTDTVTGLGHLEGETVKVLVEGVVDTDKTVSSGQIVLDAVHPAGSVVIVGLGYTSKLVTLDIEAGGDLGSSQGNRQRIDRIAMRLYKSQKGSYANSLASTQFDLEYEDNLAFTGIVRLDFEITPNMDNQIDVEHDDPVPFNILSMTYRGVSYD